jgi:hypothetical protein
MRSCHFPPAAALCGLLLSTATGYAQELALVNVGRFFKADAYYEYNKDGVPLIGLVTARLKSDFVKFTSCNNDTIEVDFKELKLSIAPCPPVPNDPRKRDYGPWKTTTKSIAPLIKVETGSNSAVVKFEDQDLDLSGLPTSYKQFLSIAKAGEPVGYVFTGDDGQKSLAILSGPPPGAM